jgi:hypothetical protein
MTKSKWNSLLLISFVTFLTTISCSKGKDNTPVTNTDLLTAKAWKIESSGVDANKDGTIDLADSWAACELDNTFLFVSDGTGVSDEGPEKCTPSDPQSGSFSWAFKSGETAMSLNIPTLSITADANIKTLNESLFEVYKDTAISGIPIEVRYIFRFKH